MMRALFTAASGMIAQQYNIDTISNNLANVNTTGFRNNLAQFQDLIYQHLRAPGTPVGSSIVPSDKTSVLGVKIGARKKNSPKACCSRPATRSTSRSRATGSSK